jgi:hypothetical protein
MTDEYTKDQTAQLVFNAEIKKDIDTIKSALGGIQSDLKIYAAQFVPNATFIEYKKESEKLTDSYDRRIRFLERYAWASPQKFIRLFIWVQVNQNALKPHIINIWLWTLNFSLHTKKRRTKPLKNIWLKNLAIRNIPKSGTGVWPRSRPAEAARTPTPYAPPLLKANQ